MQMEENKPLAQLTTFALGGPARWYVEARSEDEAVEAVRWARERDLPLFVLGGGSNLLVSDSGFNGLVLHMAIEGIDIESTPGDVKLLHAGAGVVWDDFVGYATQVLCAGVECLAGIPGTVGGTPVQNVGAYGQEVSTAIAAVRAYDLREGKFVTFRDAECGFGYRRSRFNSDERGRYLVTRVTYRLQQGGQPEVRYPDLQKALADRAAVSLTEVAEAVREVRRAKGMLYVAGDPDCRSAGSFFKNPVVPVSKLDRIRTVAGKEPPAYPAETGLVKLSAAWLIEQGGFPKGFSLDGRAAVSSRHTLALVNRENATAAGIDALAQTIVAGVESRFGVHLEMEPVRVGF